MKVSVCLVASLVALVTAAPAAREEEMVNELFGDQLNRAKRMEETMYYGNQQNTAQLAAKKKKAAPGLPGLTLSQQPEPKANAPSLLPVQTAAVAEGVEPDQGGLVVAGEQTALTPDLEARMEAAHASGGQEAKYGQALEAAMHQAVASALGPPSSSRLPEEEATSDGQEEEEGEEEEGEKEVPSEEDASALGDHSNDEDDDNDDDGEDHAGEEEVGGEEEEGGAEPTADADDEVEEELKEASEADGASSTGGGSYDNGDAMSPASSGGEEGGEGGQGGEGNAGAGQSSMTSLPEGGRSREAGFLQKLREQSGGVPSRADLGPQTMDDYYRNTYQYVLSGYPQDQRQLRPQQQQQLQRQQASAASRYPYLPIYLRRRRSSSSSSRGLSKGRRRVHYRLGHHVPRRIKRDLLDGLGIPAAYDQPEDDGYLPALTDDVSELSDEDLDYLYARLLPYLAQAYEQDAEEDGYDLGVLNDLDLPARPSSFSSSSSSSPSSSSSSSFSPSYDPYAILLDEADPVDELIYEEPELAEYQARPYEDAVEPVVPWDAGRDEFGYGLEKRGGYYPSSAARKRYFFPFNDEPETHWGAFVPEKRDYDEAIRRLQRLAMALDDEQGPYYYNALRDYRRKRK